VDVVEPGAVVFVVGVDGNRGPVGFEEVVEQPSLPFVREQPEVGVQIVHVREVSSQPSATDGIK
jgi:hypothetical protein